MATGSRTATHIRPDIQGLRAVAVVLVVLNHLFDSPAGGFIGVDVFFVISGFLITGILLREHERSGRISAAQFYRRRVRRIVPAATATLLVTCALAWFIFPAQRARSISLDGVSAFFFGANFRFAAVGKDYFNSTGAVSPVQHFWSLSVEEQFYFVWPWLLLAVLVLAARSGRGHGRLLAGIAITVASAASFAWALRVTQEAPVDAYYSSLSRVWELGVGALLAIVAPWFTKWPVLVRTAVSWVGLAVIGVGVVTISADTAFPAPGALLPVVGAALVLCAGIGGPQPYAVLLTNPVSRYVGDISYSLYLVHFPVIILLGAALRPSALSDVLALVLMFLVASLSYWGIERPVLDSTWLLGRAARRERRAAGTNRRRADPYVRRYVGLLAFGALASLTAVTVAVASAPAPPVISVSLPDDGSAAGDGVVPVSAELKSRQTEIVAALQETGWPQLSPPVSELGRGSIAPEWGKDECLAFEDDASDSPADLAERCVYGKKSATHTVAVVGDSQALSWVPALRESLGADWKIHVFTAAQCPYYDVPTFQQDGEAYPECQKYVQFTQQQVKQLRPDLLIATSAKGKHPKGTDLATAAATALRTYTTLAGSVVVLPPPPPATPLADCKTVSSVPADCTGRPNPKLTAADSAGAKDADVDYLDPVPWFCVEEICPAFIDGVTVLVDGGHLTAEASRASGPVLVDTLRQHLVNEGRGDLAKTLGS